MLSVPNPSLAAKFVGHILSIIDPSMPHNPYKAILYFPGDLVGEPEPFPITFLLGDAPPKLFLAPVEDVELVLLCLVIEDYPELLIVDYLFASAYFL